jgi:hypothetical protein
MWPVAQAVRAYIAPLDRNAEIGVPFDPASQGEFDLDQPLPPFLDLGWVQNFQRTADPKFEALRAGPLNSVSSQYRTQLDAGVEFDLPNWGKLQMALAGGGQQFNVLASAGGGPSMGSGGAAAPAVYVQDGARPIELPLAAAALANFQAGDLVAVDWDYQGQAGYLGSGIPGTYLAAGVDAASHIDLVRRVTFNVSRVSSKTSNSLYLAQSVIAAPQTGMGVQKVVAILDREGGSYLQEWAALFVIAGGTGGRICFFYPRLQAAGSPGEVRREIEAPFFGNMLHAKLRAMPTLDPNDGETVLCYRSYFPAANAAV